MQTIEIGNEYDCEVTCEKCGCVIDITDILEDNICPECGAWLQED